MKIEINTLCLDPYNGYVWYVRKIESVKKDQWTATLYRHDVLDPYCKVIPIIMDSDGVFHNDYLIEVSKK